MSNIYASSPTLTNCTFSDNAAPDGGGLYSDGELLLRNTILANNTGGNCRSVIAGAHNLQWPGTRCGATGCSRPGRVWPP